MTDFIPADFELIDPNTRAARLGLVTLSTDLTIEDELRFFYAGTGEGIQDDRGAGLSLLHSRIPCDNQVTADNLLVMEGHFASALELFPPQYPFDVIGYGCTSASMLMGEARVQQLIKNSIDATHVTTPMTAAVRGLRALGAKRIGYLAPYTLDISQKICDRLTDDGFVIAGAVTFNEDRDSIVGQMTPASIVHALDKLMQGLDGAVDALFVSCTSLKCASIIDSTERALGVPIISSNSAIAWDMARLAGVSVGGVGKGRLFQVS